MSSQFTTRIIYLNVGGTKFTTAIETLRADDDCLLADWFLQPNPPLVLDRNQNYFLDRDPDCFAIILNYLRLRNSGQLWEACLPKDPDRLAMLTQEAEYFRLPELKEQAIHLLHTCTEKTNMEYFNQMLVESKSFPMGLSAANR